MKTLITILSLLVYFQSAQANHSPGYSDFHQIAANDYSVKPLCPADAVCIIDGTVIELDYIVNCSTSMVSFSYSAIEKNEDLHVYISTVIGSNDSHGQAVCLSFRNVKETITLPNQFGKVILHHLGASELF